MTDKHDAIAELNRRGLATFRVKQSQKVPSYKGWREELVYDRSPQYFDGFNIGVACDLTLDNEYLVIIDVDPRNGGFEGIQKLQDDFGDLPFTFKVRTGSGGDHYYYKSKEKLKPMKFPMGVDFLAVGKFAVAPGSTHENGNDYYIDHDDEIEYLPKAIAEYVKSKTNEHYFDGKTGHFSEMKKVTEGGRNDYLTSVAGAMRRSGLSFEAIYSALKQTNLEKCNPALSDKDVHTIAKSISRYEPEMAATADIPTKIDVKKAERPTKPNSIDQGFKELFKSSDGLTNDLSTQIMENCDRRYYQFALASAIAILGTAAQGSHTAPQIGENSKGLSLSLYQWLIAPSAAGKDAYRHAVDTYINALDKRLVYDKPGSSHGFLASFFASNSGLTVQDEMQDFMKAICASGTGNHLNSILSTWKELTNDLKVLNGRILARTRYPNIELPRYSIFGLGTRKGFLDCITSDFVSNGLMSRFLIIPVENVPFRVGFGSRVEPDKTILSGLDEIMTRGITDVGMNQDYTEEILKLQKSMTEKGAKPVKHRAQFNPGAVQMRFTPDARLAVIDYSLEQEKVYKKYLQNDDAESDLSPGSIADRVSRFMIKVASIHAVGRGNITVDETDIDFGFKYAKLSANYVIDTIQVNVGENDHEKLAKKILAILKKSNEPMKRREIYRKTSNRYKSREINEALEKLAISEQVTVYEKLNKDLRPLDLSTTDLPTRGVLFGA